MDRIRERGCQVRNPFNARQVSEVSLDPADVEVIVFWTRNAAPLLPHLEELDARGFRYYFLYTLTGYPRELEPKCPMEDQAVATISRLAERVGRERIVWRYDPILFTTVTPPEYHEEQFARLAGRLGDMACRVKISRFIEYRGAGRRLRQLAQQGIHHIPCPPESPAFADLMQTMAAAARAFDLEIASCAETLDLTPYGIPPGKCIDEALIHSVFGLDVSARKDPGQRPTCRCVPSKDIGQYDTCQHGCVYCYATH